MSGVSTVSPQWWQAGPDEPGYRSEGAVKSPPVPDGPRVDKLRAWHPPVRDHVVEQRQRDPDIHGGFLAREAAAWNRSRFGEGARHGLLLGCLLIGHCCERAAHRQRPGFDFLNQVRPSIAT